MNFRDLFPFKYLFPAKVKSADSVIKAYRKAALVAADAIDGLAIGKCIGFDDIIKAWYLAEKEYVEYGFQPIPTEELVNYVGWGGKAPNWGAILSGEPVYYSWDPDKISDNFSRDVSGKDKEFSGKFAFNVGERVEESNGTTTR